MQKIKDLNERQTFWSHKDNYFIASTSIDGSEIMVFSATKEAEVEHWGELYVHYEFVTNHEHHMTNFKELWNGS